MDGLNLFDKPEVVRDDPVLCHLHLLVDDDAFGVKVPDCVQPRIAEDFWPTQVPRTPIAEEVFAKKKRIERRFRNYAKFR